MRPSHDCFCTCPDCFDRNVMPDERNPEDEEDEEEEAEAEESDE